MQPCKLYFGEPGIGGPAGMPVRGGHKKERKKKKRKERAREIKKE